MISASNIQCAQCGKSFVPKYGAICCSVECRKERNRVLNRERNAAKREGLPINRECARHDCGNMFIPAGRAHKYCCKRCAAMDKAALEAQAHIPWSLLHCPYSSGAVRLEGGRVPDAALGF